jgi:hypothetical protein
MCSQINRIDAPRTARLQPGREMPTAAVQSHCSEAHHSTGSIGQVRRIALWGPRIESAALALLSSALAPAVVMTAIWHEERLAPMVFAFTLIIALSHAIVVGLPLLLVCLWRRSMDLGSCVFLGSLIGAVPAGILTFPIQHSQFLANAWISEVPFFGSEMMRSATWGAYIEPLIYLGLLGALGGLVFWTVLSSTDAFSRRGG